ncbi:hypothetical protein PTKIN_Ptkin10aG0023400 [Pterospermum kingtungense]
MASMTGPTTLKFTSLSTSFKQTRVTFPIFNVPLCRLAVNNVSFPSLRTRPGSLHFHVCCAAKPETVKKVCEIVKKQLALPDDSPVAAESKFSELGADSLDTIVMGIEEEFGISVEEDSAQKIVSVQDAADLIEKLQGENN